MNIHVSTGRGWLAPGLDAARHARPLLRSGALLRWGVIALVAMRAAMGPPPLSTLTLAWLVAVASYNTALPWLGDRLSPPAAARAAQVAVLADAGALLVLVQIFAGDPPGALYAGLTLVLLEAMLCWDARGVVTSSAVALVGLAAMQGARWGLLHAPVGWSELLTQNVVIAVVSTALVMAHRQLADVQGLDRAGPGSPPVAAGIRLTSREREVLALLAEGCSNAMIARRLHLTESTIKRHVESILNRLNVRNRAGAVAVASRLGLLD